MPSFAPARLVSLVFAAVVACAGTSASTAEPFAVASMDDFLEYQYALRAAVDSGEGKFASLSPSDRTRLLRAQDDIFRILDRKTSVKRLSERDKRVLYNAQHVVAAVVTKNDDDRSVCRSANDLGTHIGSVKCFTVAETEARRIDNRDRFARLQKCKGAECAGP